MTFLKIIAVTGCIGVIGAAGGFAFMPSLSYRGTAAVSSVPAEPSAAHLRVLLARVGLTPERLAAAGCSAESAGAVIAAAKDHYRAVVGDVFTADAELAAATREQDTLRRLVVAGRASESERTAFSQATTRLAATRTTRDAVFSAFFNAAITPLGESIRANLAAQRQHAWAGSLPVEFLAATKSDEQWLALRDALDSVAASQYLGEEPDTAAVQLISQVRSDAGVAAAQSSLDQNLALVTATWEQSTSSL